MEILPARSPHQSGVCEVMVREAKLLLMPRYNDNSYRTFKMIKEFLLT